MTTKLPEILPVFPLTGVLLLPGMTLPLHIFEPRYRHMVEDALDSDKIFGIIQPFVPRQDNRPLPGAEKETPELYRVGCAGYIDTWEKSADGRFVIELQGIHRFRFEEELPVYRGYRRVKAIYEGFADETPAADWHCERTAVLAALIHYGKAHGMEVKPEQAERFTDFELVNLLGASLPFYPAEKQALLEAPAMKEREMLLLDLLRLGTSSPDSSDRETKPRTLN